MAILDGRWIRNPVELRRRSYYASVVVIATNMVSSGGIIDDVPSMIYPITWLLLPVVALGIGYGEAFFIEHGRGVRRAVVTGLAGALIGLLSCVLLAGLPGEADSTGRRLAVTGLSGILFGSLLYSLAAFIGLGAGKGSSYAARRIADSDDENW